MMLMKFSDLSKPDYSNWVKWQVKDSHNRGEKSVWPEKNSFHNKCKDLGPDSI